MERDQLTRPVGRLAQLDHQALDGDKHRRTLAPGSGAHNAGSGRGCNEAESSVPIHHAKWDLAGPLRDSNCQLGPPVSQCLK